MRLGKPVENLQAALRAFYGAGQPAEQILTIAKQLSYFGYLSHDALVWVRVSPYFDYVLRLTMLHACRQILSSSSTSHRVRHQGLAKPQTGFG